MARKPARPKGKINPAAIVEALAEQQLIADIASYTHDPLGFVVYAFPWGEPGTPLEHETGPDTWQREILSMIGGRLRAGVSMTEAVLAVRIAIASGHGIGKSCLIAWIILWGMATHEDTRGVVTANTMGQLTTKTWPEVAKWHRMLICRHWFQHTATAIYSVEAGREKTWRIDALPWSENNPEAFAGTHNKGKRIIVLFDEASAIHEKIWETVEGALTDSETEILWCAFGNPTQNSGSFREAFGSKAHRWETRQIDSRTVKITNKAQLDEWVSDYGEDSDFVRVRVRGVFPRAGFMEFISGEVADDAQKREPIAHLHDPLVIGVDVARYGDDRTVIVIRKGRDARTHEPVIMRNADTMTIASRVHDLATQLKADAVFVDETGVGAGVVDRLLQLRLPGVIGINFGSKSDRVDVVGENIKGANKRAEMWGNMRLWLRGGAIPAGPDYRADLVGVQYGYNAHNEVQLEKKEDMKKRGLASPDWGDALALTFAYPVSRNADAGRHSGGQRTSRVVGSDYDPLEHA